jgi:chorismate mutase
MPEQRQDPVVISYRQRISDADGILLETINRRLELVSELHAYKAERGYPVVDPAREKAMVTQLEVANAGPLSADGVHELTTWILGLTKRELSRKPRSPRE